MGSASSADKVKAPGQAKAVTVVKGSPPSKQRQPKARRSRAKYHATDVEEHQPAQSRAVVAEDAFKPAKGAEKVARYGVARIDSGAFVSKKEQQNFRRLGRAGPSSLDHPLTQAAQRGGKDFLIVAEKIRRVIRLRIATLKRVATANERKQAILDLLDSHDHLGCHAAKAVAEIAGVSADYVRRIRKRKKPT